MKVFVSSLISGLEPIREAARSAIRALGHEPIMAEDFGARPQSPQVACLDGLRQSSVVVLILGEKYGAKQQPSGISATHEEYREARERRPVIAFVQEGVEREPDEAALVQEVQGWSKGLFRGGFRTAAELQEKITRALHEWEMANLSGPVDSEALQRAALALMPTSNNRGYASSNRPGLALAIVSGPQQAILRPSEIEAQAFRQKLLQTALFGGVRVFDPRQGSDDNVESNALHLRQGDNALIRLDPQGGILIRLPLPQQDRRTGGFSAIIEEEVQQLLASALGYASWLLDEIDPTNRLTQAALSVTLAETGMMPWRSRSAHDASRNSMSMRMAEEQRTPITLSPPVRPRAAIHHDADRLVEDFITLLRRSYQTEH